MVAVIQSEEGGSVLPVTLVKVTVFHLGADRFVSLDVRHRVAGPYVDGAVGGCDRCGNVSVSYVFAIFGRSRGDVGPR